MMRIPCAAIFAAIASSGAAAGGDMIEGHAIGLGPALAVGGVVFSGVWWLSHKLTQLQDGQHTTRDQLNEFKTTALHNFNILKNQIENLPCRPNGCPGNSKSKNEH